MDDAVSIVISKMSTRARAQTVDVLGANGRVAAKDVVAGLDMPESDCSHMDGFAVMSRDLRSASQASPVTLRVVGALPPGSYFGRPLKSGEAVQIATGGFVPLGADAVVPVEEAKAGDGRVVFRCAPAPSSHIYRRGEDVRKGTVLLNAGSKVRAQDVGMLLTAGFTKVRVWPRPRASVIATGSELTSAARPKAGKVRNSHSPTVIHLCTAAGCDTSDQGVVGDDLAALSGSVRKALAASDVVFTLGGTSAGRKDLVVEAVSRLKPEVLVHGVKMDRGRVAGIAAVRGRPVVMLPGPIQGAVNGFLLMGLPIIEHLARRRTGQLELPCTLAETWEARRRFQDFRKVVYVKLSRDAGYVAAPLSADTESFRVLTEADGYMVVPEGVSRIDSGSRVSVRLLPGFSSLL